MPRSRAAPPAFGRVGFHRGRGVYIADVFREFARSTGVAKRDRQPLGFVAGEQASAAPALHHGCKFPGQVRGVIDAGIHAEAAGRREQMHRVARKQHAAIGEFLGHQRNSRGPGRMPDDVER